ncbi:MAG: Holliday junction DNA helicase RuvB C-terminal domain-containing protein [Planctomycetota bacterium]|nr:Holliday junction DNA helicase RuvB C-terminal domain-containing protein [Planctomycetota bacterium]
MRALAECLKTYAEQHFSAAIARDPNGPVRPVMVGPPDSAIRELFSILTSAGQHDWHLVPGTPARDVVVLLVDPGAPAAGTGLSQVCGWDYAVSIRNSRPRVLILASRRSWDNRPESLANTTETIGQIGSTRAGDDPLQAHLTGAVATRLALQEPQARDLLRLVRTESSHLEPAARDAMTWEVIDRLLSTVPGPSGVDAACRAAGLPVLGASGAGFRGAYDTLAGLGKFVATEGLRDAIDQMKATAAAQQHGIGNSLDSLYTHLSASLFSPTLLQTAPSRYYRVTTPSPSWYDALTTPVLAEILAELDQGPQQGRLALACTNGLAGASPVRKGPFVVTTTAELQASAAQGAVPGPLSFTRKVDRAQPVAVPPLAMDPSRVSDAAAPAHRKPLTYKVEANNFRAGTVDVIVLQSFACGGLVVARDAERNGLPVHAARSGAWTQELSLSRGGNTDLTVFHVDSVTHVSVGRPGEAPQIQATAAGAWSTVITVDVEDNDTFTVTLTNQAGTTVGEWTLLVTVQDIADVASSRLAALIREHREPKRKCIPHAPDNAIHRLELGSYLGAADSWRPVIACWTSEGAGVRVVDWTASRSLGDVTPQIDPRPAITPPPALLAAREAVRTVLNQEQRCISEIDLGNAALAPLVSEYLRQYHDWLAQDASAAGWLDVMAIHTAEWNAQAGRHVATDEPVVILLSPLHPLRLAWHATAQRQLADSLAHPCPGAGLLSPAHCPDAALLQLWDGHALKPRAFFSLPCEHPHWAVLINTAYLDRPVPRAEAMRRLFDLGLQVQAITGGFTAQQTEDSLDEVNRLLPARATLRVGIVGDAETSSECGDGVFRWSKAQHSQDFVNPSNSLRVEVFDTRGASDPSPEELADLSEITGERARWFKLHPAAQVPKLDLTIIDQLGARSHEAVAGGTRSATTPGVLYRARIREDFHDARSILESRVSTTRLAGNDLPSLLSRTVQQYEQLVNADAQHTHFRFTPNQDAVGSRLRDAIFLSLTSNQVDPACIVRGTVSQSGFLWDYELPGVLGGGESSLGYYLVAQPTTAMCDAVEHAASLVVNPPPSIPGLLEEVSRHGIPILKRLASGGSQSRGELGLLLATRLLQDAFRPNATTARLPVWLGSCIHLVLPVDPYEDLFDRLRRASLPASASAQRPDLLVVAIQLPAAAQPVSIKITPVEIKYRATGMAATDMRDALTQAQTLGGLLQALWTQPPASDLWRTCVNALLAQLLDFAFRIYAAHWLHQHPNQDWAAVHQRTMQDVLEGTARITVTTAGRLVVFDGSQTTRVADLDGDHRQDTIIVSQDDARALLSGGTGVSVAADTAVTQMDFSFPGCGAAATPPAATAPPAVPVTPVPTAPPLSATQAPVAIPELPAAPVPAQSLAPTAGQTPASTAPTRPSAANLTATPAASPTVAAITPATQPQAGSRVPSEVRQRVRDAFEGFIGNEPAVTRLSNDLLRALIENPPHLAKNYLFTGLPSTGKTELARRMSRALGLPFVKLDGRGVSSRDKLFEMVNGELSSHNLTASQVGQQVGLPVLEYPPLIIFIDEVHLVPRALQEALLTMLEAADRTVVLNDHVARVQRTTFLFATTRVSDVDAAFASRCDEIQLREYTEAEVARILRWKVPHDDWPEPVYESVARLGRRVPRIAIQLAEALETAVLVAEESKTILDHLEEVRRAREIDARGLTRMDFEYLAILERANAPVGEQNILNLMRTVDKDRILNDVEPFLVRLGFIRHGPRGRELTSEGREYLLAHRASGRGGP